MKSEKIAIYPYNNDMYSILQYSSLLEGKQIVYVLSPHGYGLVGKKIQIDDREWVVQETIDSFQSQNLDRVWITSAAEQMADSELFTFIESIAKLHIPILVSAEFGKETRNKIVHINQTYNNLIEFIDESTEEDNLIGQNIELEVPIVVIFGVGEMTQKFDLQLYLRKYFQTNVKVCQIGTRNDGRLFGMHTFPDFMIGTHYSEKEKVVKFKNWIKKLEITEKPDVIILGIPGGVLPLNEKHTFDYGILAYMLFSAIKPDYTIFSLYAGQYDDEFYLEMNKLCKYRYSFDLDSIFISKYTPVSNSLQDEVLSYASIRDVKKGVSKQYTVFDNNDLKNELLYSSIYQTLELYATFNAI